MRVLIPRPITAALCLVIGLSGAARAELEGCRYTFEKIDCVYDRSAYHLRMPAFLHPNYRVPAVVILHDAGRTGAAILDDERLIEAFVDKGYAVLAPDALTRENRRIHYRGEKVGPMQAQVGGQPVSLSKKRFVMTDIDGTIRDLKFTKDTGWYFYNVDQSIFLKWGDRELEYIGRDEIKELRDLLAHAAEKYGIDPDPVLIIGLGHGGSLVWQIACSAPKFAQILAPVGGAFWREIPKNCKPGANLVHTHHRASAFWPLAGVEGNARNYARTNIDRNLKMLRRKNRCSPDKTTVRHDEIGLSHTIWEDCPDGGPVELMVLDEAFAFQTWWLEAMLDRIEISDSARTLPPELPLETGPVFKQAGSGLEPRIKASRFKKPGSGSGPRFRRAK